MEPNAPAQVNPAALSLTPPQVKCGIRTTQFWLLAGVLALVAAMVFAGRLGADWFAVVAPIAAIIYQVIRESLYRDLAAHPGDTLDKILTSILDRLPDLDAKHLLALVVSLTGSQPLTPNQETAVPKAADVPAPQPPAQPSPAPTSAPSASESGTAGDVQLLPIAEHPHIDVLKEKYGADANGNFPPGSKLSGVMTLVKVGLPLAPDASSSSSSSSLSSLGAAVVTAFLIAGLFLSGCQTLQAIQADPRVQFAEREALKIGVAALSTYSNGGNIDSMWGITQGVYALTDTISAISAKNPTQADANAALATQLAQTIQSYASTKDTRALAGKIAAIITKANPQTDAQRTAVVSAVAGSLQNAAKWVTDTDGKNYVPAIN